MRHRIAVAVLVLASVPLARADSPTLTATLDRMELASLARTLDETSEEPVGLKVARLDAVLAKLKLATGDVIRAVNGGPAIRSGAMTSFALATAKIVYLDVVRGTQPLVVRIVVKQPASADARLERAAIEDQLDRMRDPAAKRLAAVTRNGKPSGVVVLAPLLAFEEGDILRSIDGVAVATNAQVADAFARATDHPAIAIKLDRQDQPMALKLAIEKGLTEELVELADKGIKRLDDTHYEIAKAVLEAVLANPLAVAKGARVVPAMKDGKPEGFKLYAIRPSSVYAKLGLTNGDTIVAVNGFALTSADKALEVYTKVRQSSRLVVELVRRGKPVTITYTIR